MKALSLTGLTITLLCSSGVFAGTCENDANRKYFEQIRQCNQIPNPHGQQQCTNWAERVLDEDLAFCATLPPPPPVDLGAECRDKAYKDFGQGMNTCNQIPNTFGRQQCTSFYQLELEKDLANCPS